MDEYLQTKGYTHGKDLLTRKFPGADHNEAAWRALVDVPLRFLMDRYLIMDVILWQTK